MSGRVRVLFICDATPESTGTGSLRAPVCLIRALGDEGTREAISSAPCFCGTPRVSASCKVCERRQRAPSQLMPKKKQLNRVTTKDCGCTVVCMDFVTKNGFM